MYSRSWPLPAIILAAALVLATPAGATVIPPEAELTAPVPSEQAETSTAPAAPLPQQEVEAPGQPAPDPSASVPAPGTNEQEPIPALPVPSATSTAPEEDPADPAEKDLESLIGILGASMGQGLERIEETQDPQVPGDKETAERIEAEQTLIQEDLADPDLAIPTDTGSESGPDAAGAAAPAVFSMSAQRDNTVTLAAAWTPPGVQGMDVSSHQPSVNWAGQWNKGSRYAYVKATEATSYKNPLFSSQYKGAAGAGMLRGAYHFAIPNTSSGAAQANYFVNNGGSWSGDGKTLPPLLDIEYNPYPELGNTCYNMSPAKMVQWIKDFSTTVAARTGRLPMIYTTTDWWKTCTGNSSAFAAQPLHVAAYGTKTAGALPNGWKNYTLWQYSSTGPFEGDSNVYNGSLQQLNDFARGKSPIRTATLHYRGASASSVAYGHTSDSFVACDWDGNGVSTPAAFRDGTWYIRNNLTGTASVTEIRYGERGDQPICGDWDGDGRDTVGVYRNGMAYLRNANTTGKADGTFAFGESYDVPLVGDWNGDGFDTLGVARADRVATRFYLTDSNIRPSVSQNFLYGNAGDTPVSGDWNDDGYSTVGVQRGIVWYLTDSHNRPVASTVFAYGNLADRPLTGVWSQGAGTSIGVAR